MRIVTSIDIDASAHEVWSVLSDLDAYPEWNPFTTRVSGALEVGNRVRLRVRLGGRKVSRTHEISQLQWGRRLCWSIISKRQWLIRGERCQHIEAVAPERCRYHNIEEVRGLVAPLISLFFKRPIASGLQAMNEALKNRAEGRVRQDASQSGRSDRESDAAASAPTADEPSTGSTINSAA